MLCSGVEYFLKTEKKAEEVEIIRDVSVMWEADYGALSNLVVPKKQTV